MPRQKPSTFDLTIRLRVVATRCSAADAVDGVNNLLDAGAIQKVIVEHVAEEHGENAIEIIESASMITGRNAWSAS